MYSISGFDVARCAQRYRLSDSPLLIRFNELTDFEELTEPVSPLPEEGFRFRNQSELAGLANTNAQLPGGLFLNATSGTHIYFDKETNAGEVYFYKLVARDTGAPPAAPLLKGYAKVETLTVSELNGFIASASSQEIDFICTGKVVRLDVDKGWCYVACSKCSKKLQRTVSALECMRCSNANAVGVLRYRVELAFADDTAEGAFVCFDGVMTKLHNLRVSEAGQMLAEEGVNPEESRVPPFITDMEGKTFQVRVSSYNFTAHHQTFTITRILKEHERVPVPDFVVNGGNDADDDDGADGSAVPVQVVNGEGSSGAANDAEEIPNGPAPKNVIRSADKAAKKARVV
ncbi:hypothetical protein BRARA_A00711 [Brassica rapa]|uniref:Replication factor A C-terminal domain-containing protein n=1 Tax=Brassica campestris TaxID=3711 RepID=A0A398AJ95_BRACM|nr:hypothetical protein BRARA_A00711 [Brassica rapa]